MNLHSHLFARIPCTLMFTLIDYWDALATMCMCMCGICDDSVGMSRDPHMRSWWLGFLAGASELTWSSDQGLGVCVGHTLRSACCGCTLPLGTGGTLGVGGLYLWWVQNADCYGGYALWRRYSPQQIKDSSLWTGEGTMSNVHATYPVWAEVPAIPSCAVPGL